MPGPGYTWADVTYNQPSDVTAINNLGNSVETLLNEAWIDWSASFAIVGSTTSPTLGNSTVTAEYSQIGKRVFCAFQLSIGSTFSAGSGNYGFVVPFAPTTNAQRINTGVAKVFVGGVTERWGGVEFDGNGRLRIAYDNNAGATLGSSGSGSRAWTAGDYIKAAIVYESQ